MDRSIGKRFSLFLPIPHAPEPGHGFEGTVTRTSDVTSTDYSADVLFLNTAGFLIWSFYPQKLPWLVSSVATDALPE